MTTAQVAVFYHHPECSIQSAHGVLRALSEWYRVELISVQDLDQGCLSLFDLLVVPGGIGDSNSYAHILAPRAHMIRHHMQQGGSYLGICMGAYWAGSHYLNICDRIEPVQYIKRPGAEIRRSYSTVCAVDWNNHSHWMYFYDGCCIVNHGGSHQVIARYRNGDSAAVIQRSVGLIGPHPESDVYWYQKPYLQPHWHQYQHSQLLAQFVQQLLQAQEF